MCRNAVIVYFVHLTGTYLHLDTMVFRAKNGCVNGPVTVRFWGRNVILEPPRYDFVIGMQIAKNLVTLRHVFHQHPKRHDVRQFTKGDILALHLLPDRIWPFFTPVNINLQALAHDNVFKLGDNAINNIVVFLAQELQPRKDRVTAFRIDMLKRQIFEFFLDVMHTDAFGKRGINFKRFCGDAHPFFGFVDVMQRAHIVQAVRQLDQQNPNVF